MRIGDVIGTVTLNRVHPSLSGARWKIVVPLTAAQLMDEAPAAEGGAAEDLVVYDRLGAGIGSRIAFSEGREAAQPFHPEVKPIDAYCAAILDQVRIDPAALSPPPPPAAPLGKDEGMTSQVDEPLREEDPTSTE